MRRIGLIVFRIRNEMRIKKQIIQRVYKCDILSFSLSIPEYSNQMLSYMYRYVSEYCLKWQ